MERATSRFDAPAIASQLLTRGFYVCDHFLDSPLSTAAVLAGIQALDSTGKMRVGKIQQGINLKSNTDSRTDRIAFLPSPQATKSRKQADDILRKREALNTDSSATLTVEAEDCNEALLAYTHAADAMRAQLTDVKALVERVGGVLDDFAALAVPATLTRCGEALNTAIARLHRNYSGWVHAQDVGKSRLV